MLSHSRTRPFASSIWASVSFSATKVAAPLRGVPVFAIREEIGRDRVPYVGLDMVYRHAFALVVHAGEIVLCRGVSLLGERTPFLKGPGVVSAHIGAEAFIEVRQRRHCGADDQESAEGATHHGHG